MKIAIAFPSMGNVDAAFAVSLAMLFSYEATKKENELFTISIESSTLTAARNKCVRIALDSHADKILFIDSDIVFPPDGLSRLLDLKKDIVGASYPKRSGLKLLNFLPVKNRERYNDFEIEPVVAIGAGFLLIDCKALQIISAPWFDWYHHTQAQINANRYLKDLFFTIKNPEFPAFISEDYYFCAKAREHGYEVYMDKALTMRIGHVGKKVFKFGDIE